jgi:hypothetical protein
MKNHLVCARPGLKGWVKKGEQNRWKSPFLLALAFLGREVRQK